MKKVLTGILCMLLLVSCMGISAFAATEDVHVHESEFVFEEELPLAMQQKIIDTFAEDAPIEKASILCLFGHKLDTGTMGVISHKVRASAPRCLNEIYSYEICTRSSCDYSKYTKLSQAYINCC